MFALENPFWLLPVLLCALGWLAVRLRVAERPDRLSVACGAGAFVLLACAAAGLQWRAQQPQLRLAVLADVSASVFDPAAQDARLRSLLAPLDAEHSSVALGVFADGAAIERSWGPPPAPAAPEPLTGTALPWPDLRRPGVVLPRAATRLDDALRLGRAMFAPQPGAEVSPPGARAMLLFSDFRATAGVAAAELPGLQRDGIELLLVPVALSATRDLVLNSLELPPDAPLGRPYSVVAGVSAAGPATVKVALYRRSPAGSEQLVDTRWLDLRGTAGPFQQSVRFQVEPAAPGIEVLTARVSGPDGESPGDVLANNQLSGALRIHGPSRWALLARPGGTLAQLAARADAPLGVALTLFEPGRLPALPEHYAPFGGVLVDGLSAAELREGPELRALAAAVESGKALVALGGPQAFGAGGHREGAWAGLLPVEMLPDDDRARTVLFLIDTSKSMDERIQRGGASVRKIDFAAEQLAQALQRLKPSDRTGLITFSGTAQLAAAPGGPGQRGAFLNAVKSVQIAAQTDLAAALKLARDVLARESSSERLIVLLSDGVQTVDVPRAEIVNAAAELVRPQPGGARTTLHTFGIGVSPADANPAGEALLKDLAAAGGGAFSPEFLKLGERLEAAIEARMEDRFYRRDPVAFRRAAAHPLLPEPGLAFAALPARNRVKARPEAGVLLVQGALDSTGEPALPDPLAVVSGAGSSAVSRRVVLALPPDGPDGQAWLQSPGGAALLANALAWAEGRSRGNEAWSIHPLAAAAEPDPAHWTLAVRAQDTASSRPLTLGQLTLTVAPLDDSGTANAVQRVPLPAVAPGRYEARVKRPGTGVVRVSVEGAAGPLCEAFVTLPYSAEWRALGVDRAALQDLAVRSGGRVLETPRDLALWSDERLRTARAESAWPLAPLLIPLALLLFAAHLWRR